MIKNSPSIIVTEEEKLKLEKNELILKDIEGCNCQGETTKKISKINKRIKEIKKDNVKINVELEPLDSNKIVEYIKEQNALQDEVSDEVKQETK
jgi:Txe/YoeB family toxin of Txe-Axe toxin-antitoxin module